LFAYTSLYSALFWTNGVGAAFKRIECSTRIDGTIIVLDMRQSLSPTDTKDRRHAFDPLLLPIFSLDSLKHCEV
jgi:hypothetical protein